MRAATLLVLSGLALVCMQCESRTKKSETEANYFMNEWAVKVDGGSRVADTIALEYGFRNAGPVRNMKNFYHFVRLEGPERALLAADELTERLTTDSRVAMAEQQMKKARAKRSGYSPPTDPYWLNQWPLLNVGQTSSAIEGNDINVEPAWLQGYTGCNSVIGIVDDGVEFTHPDLEDNIVIELGFDYVDNDPDPSPSNRFADHGTQVAGIVGMDKGNGICGVGVAYQSSLSAIRLLDVFGATDMQEAMALSHESETIQIYSNSWGPPDSGSLVEGPGTLVQAVFMDIAQSGKGSIFVWAAGNGGVEDDCAADGYVCSIYTIGIGAATSTGSQASFDENCSCKMAVTYVTDQSGLDVTSTYVGGQCTDSFSGTSAATPMASGIIALALEANPTLTWRDVQYLIAYTSNPDLLPEGDWATNGAGLNVSHKHGFGAMDAEAMVTRAKHWENVPAQQSVTIMPTVVSNNHASISEPVELRFEYNGIDIQALEHMVVTATLSSDGNRGDMELELVSPSGTKTSLLSQRLFDFDPDGYTDWPFMSVHFWGEDPNGDWLLTFRYQNTFTNASLTNVSMTMYGVSEIPEAIERIPPECDPICKRGCAAEGPEFCDACQSLRNARTLECINECPSGHTLRNNYCYNTSLPEKQCTRNISVLEGSCRDAGYSDCCTGAECAGIPEVCFCDQECYDRQDCCPDIAATCSKGCNSFQFTCENGQCIPIEWRCDFERDCFGGEDEVNCGDCSSFQFTCENGQCIPIEWRCDSEPDCFGGEDEINCTGCSSFQFTCENGQCIPIVWRCDSEPDCFGGEDEINCTVSSTPSSTPVLMPTPSHSIVETVMPSLIATETPTPSPRVDSCVAAGYQSCCVRSPCQLPSGCYCDVACHDEVPPDCCDDIAEICVPDVTIGFFGDEIYAFEDAGAALVSVGVIDGRLVGDVVIELTTSLNGSAIPYDDYIPKLTQFTLNGTSSSNVEEITIIDDLIYESNETFAVSIQRISPSLDSVTVLSVSATVTILDNDPFCTEGSIRIFAGSVAPEEMNVTQGTLEFCNSGTWGTICGESWSNTDAAVACMQLGFSRYGAISDASGYFTQPPDDNVHLYDVDCFGTELTLLDCQGGNTEPTNCSASSPAGVICQDISTSQGECTEGEIRLVNGSSSQEGRVELCINDAWGTVCGDSWDSTDASVVCRQLGFSGFGALAITSAVHGEGSGPIFLDDLACSGDEENLLDCESLAPIGVHNCNHYQDASVYCQVEEEVVIGFNPPYVIIREGGGTAILNLQVLSGLLSEDIVVTATAYTSETAQEYPSAILHEDFLPAIGAFVFNATQLSYTFEVVIVDDSLFEANLEVVNISLNHLGVLQSPVALSDGAVIIEDDDSITFGFDALEYEVSENQERVVLSVSVQSGAVATPITLYASTIEDTATSGDYGYTALDERFLNFGPPPANNSASFALLVFDDELVEGTEDFFVNITLVETLGNPFSIILPQEVKVSIADDDDTLVPRIGFDPAVYTVREEDGRVAVSVAVLSGVIGEPVELTLFSEDGSAVGYSDYQPPIATLAFNETTNNYRISVIINDDNIAERDEYFTLGLTTNDNVDISPDSALIVILYSELATPPECVTGSIRLRDNVTAVEGIIEICVNGTWSTICDDGWDYSGAIVACNQLGLPSFGAIATDRSQADAAVGPILTGVECTGSEPALLLCTNSESGDSACTTEDNAGVICFGGVTDCGCSRNVECSLDGVYTGEDLVDITGEILKCTINFEREAVETAREFTIIDDSFNENFLSAGSFSFLKQLQVVSRPPNDINICEVNNELISHGDPGVVIQSLGIGAINVVYLNDEGVYSSFFLDVRMVQKISIEGDYSLGGTLGRENACSLQHLLYSLAINVRSSISETSCTAGTEGDATTITFEVKC